MILLSRTHVHVVDDGAHARRAGGGDGAIRRPPYTGRRFTLTPLPAAEAVAREGAGARAARRVVQARVGQAVVALARRAEEAGHAHARVRHLRSRGVVDAGAVVGAGVVRAAVVDGCLGGLM